MAGWNQSHCGSGMTWYKVINFSPLPMDMRQLFPNALTHFGVVAERLMRSSVVDVGR